MSAVRQQICMASLAPSISQVVIILWLTADEANCGSGRSARYVLANERLRLDAVLLAFACFVV
jgi:hypothetical protein